jgi:hypothetical protein
VALNYCIKDSLHTIEEKQSIVTGTDVMILKIFSLKNLAKILAFFAQTTLIF